MTTANDNGSGSGSGSGWSSFKVNDTRRLLRLVGFFVDVNFAMRMGQRQVSKAEHKARGTESLTKKGGPR